MAILKSPASVVDSAGQLVGDGMAYLHLPRGLERPQDGSGTVSLTTWTPGEAPPAVLRLGDGRQLPIELARDAISECSRNRILRFKLHWPGAGSTSS